MADRVATLSIGRWPSLLVYSTPIALGTATGWLTGQTGAEPTVVAAVLPAVLAGGGGALLAVNLKRENNRWHNDFLATCAFVLLFTVSLLIGAQIATTIYERDSYSSLPQWRRHVVQILDFRRDMLQQCSKNEAIINAGRAKLGLPPLPSAAFCDYVLSSPPINPSDYDLPESRSLKPSKTPEIPNNVP